jgi:hypothetical protein
LLHVEGSDWAEDGGEYFGDGPQRIQKVHYRIIN